MYTCVYLTMIVLIKLHDHKPLVMRGSVGTLGHEVRFACLVYFLYRKGHSGVASYLIQHMSPTWTDNHGWTLLHFACR